MRQLTALDAQFLNVESPTTVGHVGSLILLDPSTAPGGDVEPRLRPRRPRAPAPPRRAAAAAPGRGAAGARSSLLGRRPALRHRVPPARARAAGARAPASSWPSRWPGSTPARWTGRRPLWEAYVITGLEGGRRAFYSKIHHAAIDGVSGAEILETIMDLDRRAACRSRRRRSRSCRGGCPRRSSLVRHGMRQLARQHPLELLRTVPRSLRYVDQLPGAANFPGTRLLSGSRPASAGSGRRHRGRARVTGPAGAPHPAERHRSPPTAASRSARCR